MSRPPSTFAACVEQARVRFEALQARLEADHGLSAAQEVRAAFDRGELEFVRDGAAFARAQVELVGSLDARSGEWTWAWSSGSERPDRLTAALKARALGGELRFERLLASSFPASDAEAWDLLAIAAGEVAAVGGHRLRTPTGTAFLLLTSVEALQPGASPARPAARAPTPAPLPSAAPTEAPAAAPAPLSTRAPGRASLPTIGRGIYEPLPGSKPAAPPPSRATPEPFAAPERMSKRIQRDSAHDVGAARLTKGGPGARPLAPGAGSVARDARAVICVCALEQGRPILSARRGQPVRGDDSGWQFLCGASEHKAQHGRSATLAQVLALESSLAEWIDGAVGRRLERREPGEPWKTSTR